MYEKYTLYEADTYRERKNEETGEWEWSHAQTEFDSRVWDVRTTSSGGFLAHTRSTLSNGQPLISVEVPAEMIASLIVARFEDDDEESGASV